MGYIKEPAGVDLNVGPMPFSDEDRQGISAIIAKYKSTGEIPKPARITKSKRKTSINKAELQALISKQFNQNDPNI